MDNKYKYLIKNMGILTVSNFASKIMVFLLVPLYTSVLTTEEYGTYDLVVTTAQLFLPIFTLNINDAVMRFCMEREKNQESVAAIGVRFLIGSYVAAILIVLGFRLTKSFAPLYSSLNFFLLYYISLSANQFLIQLSKGMEKIVDMGVAGVLGTCVLVGGNILLLLVFHWGLVGFFMANILAQTIPALYLSVRVKVWRYFTISKLDSKLKREMLYYCTPLIFSVVGWWVNSASDRYVVTFLCGAAANGILSVSYKIPSILNVLQSIFIQAWQISAIREYGNETATKFYGDTFKILNFLMCLACTVLIMFSKPIASIMYAQDFFQAWHYVPFLLVSSVLNAASGFMGPILSACKDSRNMARSAIYGAGANLILNFTFVYLIGIQGATIATVIASFIIYQVRKTAVNNRIHIEKYWTIICTWGLLCIQAGLKSLNKSVFFDVLILFIILALNVELISKTVKLSLSVASKFRSKHCR